MMIKLTSSAADAHLTVTTLPCLCSQFAECWHDVLEHGKATRTHREALRDAASPECECGGIGLEDVLHTTLPELHLHPKSAELLLDALQLSGEVFAIADLACRLETEHASKLLTPEQLNRARFVLGAHRDAGATEMVLECV